MAKFPNPPAISKLKELEPATITLNAGTEVSRIYFSDTPYGTQWNDFRYFGPTQSRFDHHLRNDIGEANVQERGVMYLASGEDAAVTCIAEVFQETKTIDRNDQVPVYVGFTFKEDITLLDLSGNFTTKMGASTAIHSGPRPRAQRWAQHLYSAYDQIDGIFYCSSMNGNAPAIALFERASHKLEDSPLFHRELRDGTMGTVLHLIATELDYLVL